MLTKALEKSGVAGLVGWKENDDNDQDNLVQRALAAALYPFQLSISPIAIKAYLTTLLFLTTSFVLLSISSTAYAFFYYNFIPQTDLERPIYLQYGADTYPHASIPLGSNILISQQPYDINLVLHMPRDPINLAAGNFMLDLALHHGTPSMENSVLKTLRMEDQIPSSARHHSRRPALIPYSSRITSLASKLIHLPFHVLSFHDSDSVTLTIPMFEEVEFARGKDGIPTHAELEVQTQRPRTSMLTAGRDPIPVPTPQIQIYSAKLTFQVRFHGLRYLIYNYRALSFVIFTSLFYIVSICTLATVWAVAAMFLSASQPEAKSLVKSEQKIKQEPGLDTSDPTQRAIEYKFHLSKGHAGTDESENEIINLRENWSSPATAQAGFAPQPSEAASASSQAQDRHAPTILGGAPDEHADDEEEDIESEDELEQYERLRKKMEHEARQRQLQMQQHDSGIGTSMESSGPGLVRRRSSRKGSGRD